MNAAFGTSGFSFVKRTFSKPLSGVIQKFRTFQTAFLRAVMSAAIILDHYRDSFDFAFYTMAHNLIIRKYSS